MNTHLSLECPYQRVECPMFAEMCLNCTGTILRKDLISHLINSVRLANANIDELKAAHAAEVNTVTQKLLACETNLKAQQKENRKLNFEKLKLAEQIESNEHERTAELTEAKKTLLDSTVSLKDLKELYDNKETEKIELEAQFEQERKLLTVKLGVAERKLAQATAQPQNRFIGDKNGYGVHRYADGDVYSGEWKNGRIHGEGVVIRAGGFTCIGSFVNNQLVHGTMRYLNGDIYVGECEDGLPHGKGVMKHGGVNGFATDGQWRLGQPYGTLTITSQGTTFVGEVDEHCLPTCDGIHTLTNVNGDVYVGQLSKNFTRSGTGTLHLHQQTPPEITSINKLKELTYEGGFLDDKRHGTGKVTYTNGAVMDCGYVENKLHGLIVAYMPNGDIIESTYDHGENNRGAARHILAQDVVVDKA